jgi:hypothetical protein
MAIFYEPGELGDGTKGRKHKEIWEVGNIGV